MLILASILWRRLDVPGHDACQLEQSNAGWTIEGAAVFREGGVPAWLRYRVECDPEWRTRRGRVHGRLGNGTVEIAVERTSEGRWVFNGVPRPGLNEAADLDLAFTPATNLLQVRRLALAIGQAASAPAAWLDVTAGTLTLLPQRYERRSDTTYWYEAPSVGYAGLLEVGDTGFVRCYPGLWEAEA